MENGLKRRRSDDSYNNEQPPPKTTKLDDANSFKSIDSEEENDLNNVAWQMHNLQEPHEFFAHVQNQWRPNRLNNPHTNLTFRFRNSSCIKTGFNLHGTDCHFVPTDSVYTQRMSTIQQSLNAMQKEIGGLTKKYRRGTFVDQQRLDYLINYRNQLRNNMEKLRCSKDSANSLFGAYYDPFYGPVGNQITTMQKSEAEHLVVVMNNLRNFYSRPS